jgi:hypothetical protein
VGHKSGLPYWFNVLDGQYGQWTDSTQPIMGNSTPAWRSSTGRVYRNAPFTYAYSADDALGNMQTDGTGLIIAVGGAANLPNPDHVTREVQFTFGCKSPYAGGITFDQYGRCVRAPDHRANISQTVV